MVMKYNYAIFNSKGKMTRGVIVKNKREAEKIAKKYHGSKGTIKLMGKSTKY